MGGVLHEHSRMGIGIGCFQAAFNNFLVDMYRRPASSVLQPESHA